MAAPDTRKSDRWLTPGVIIAIVLVVGVIVAAVVAATAYLTARGIDPSPVLKLAANLGGALFAAATFVMQLGQRAQNSKTERNTGVLAGHTGQLVGAVDELVATVAPPAPIAAGPAPDVPTRSQPFVPAVTVGQYRPRSTP